MVLPSRIDISFIKPISYENDVSSDSYTSTESSIPTTASNIIVPPTNTYSITNTDSSTSKLTLPTIVKDAFNKVPEGVKVISVVGLVLIALLKVLRKRSSSSSSKTKSSYVTTSTTTNDIIENIPEDSIASPSFSLSEQSSETTSESIVPKEEHTHINHDDSLSTSIESHNEPVREATPSPDEHAYSKAEDDHSKADDQAHSKADDQAHSKADDQAHSKADDQAHSKADDQAHSEADDQAHSKADDQAHSKVEDSHSTEISHTEHSLEHKQEDDHIVEIPHVESIIESISESINTSSIDETATPAIEEIAVPIIEETATPIIEETFKETIEEINTPDHPIITEVILHDANNEKSSDLESNSAEIDPPHHTQIKQDDHSHVDAHGEEKKPTFHIKSVREVAHEDLIPDVPRVREIIHEEIKEIVISDTVAEDKSVELASSTANIEPVADTNRKDDDQSHGDDSHDDHKHDDESHGENSHDDHVGHVKSVREVAHEDLKHTIAVDYHTPQNDLKSESVSTVDMFSTSTSASSQPQQQLLQAELHKEKNSLAPIAASIARKVVFMGVLIGAYEIATYLKLI